MCPTRSMHGGAQGLLRLLAPMLGAPSCTDKRAPDPALSPLRPFYTQWIYEAEKSSLRFNKLPYRFEFIALRKFSSEDSEPFFRQAPDTG